MVINRVRFEVGLWLFVKLTKFGILTQVCSLSISAVSILLGAKAKLVPLWGANVSVQLNGLLEMFSTHLSRLIESFGSDLFDIVILRAKSTQPR